MVSLVRAKPGRESQTTIYPLLQWETALKIPLEPPWQQGRKQSNSQLTLTRNLTISALHGNWNCLGINDKYSDYTTCYCPWVGYTLNKNFPSAFADLTSLWSFLPMKPRWTHKRVPENLVLLTVYNRLTGCSWGRSPSQTWTMAYTYFNICINIRIDA